MNKFQKTPVCEKCLNDKTEVRHQRINIKKEEWLNVLCDRCGYQWKMQIAPKNMTPIHNLFHIFPNQEFVILEDGKKVRTAKFPYPVSAYVKRSDI